MIRSGWNALLLLLLPGLAGCLVHTRKLPAPKPPDRVETATAAQLVDQINKNYASFESLSATVEIQATVTSREKAEARDYAGIRGYVLMRKPDDLRILGLVPVVHTKAFDLASIGNRFKLLIPPKNRAIEGNGSVKTKSTNPIENLRPGFFYDAMMVKALDPSDFYSMAAETKTVEAQDKKHLLLLPQYELYVLQKKSAGNELRAARVIYFNRADLTPYQQDLYDEDGTLATQVTYGPAQRFGDRMYPGTIVIKRPVEQYQITLTIEKLTMNQELKDDQFDFKLPDSVPVQHLQ